MEPLTNWAGNIAYSTTDLHEAKSLEEIRSVLSSHERIKVLGGRHCFNSIADSREALLSLHGMDEVVEIDPAGRTVTVGAGMSYGQLCPYLAQNGFALHNLASLPHISVVGGCATATHGSGEKNGNLATSVSALEMVLANGDVLRLSREADGAAFRAAVVALGALGVVTRVTLNIEPSYEAIQHVYLNLPFTEALENFDAIQAAGYSVSLFTHWRERQIDQVWVKRREAGQAEAPLEWFGARLANRDVHPIAGMSPENCTEQMGVPGPWFGRLPHFRMGFTPSAGKELQSEYFVARRDAIEALLAIDRLRDQIAPYLLVSEIRTVAADDLWMSTAYGRPSVAIHFTWEQDWPAVRRILPLIEQELSPFQPRPHWGKLFTLPPSELRRRYERLGDFTEFARKLDPRGKFINDFLQMNLFDAGSAVL